MGFSRFTVFFLSAAIALTTRTYALTFTDEMGSAQNTFATRYFGLRPYSESSVSGLSDTSMLTFISINSPVGYSVYRVNNAERITVGIYTFCGTCVLSNAGGLTLGSGTLQAKWSKSENSVYTNQGGGFSRLYLNNLYAPVFLPTDTLPGDAIGYGLNIYASPDENSFGNPLSAVVTRSVAESLHYEEYTAIIPASAKYVKVELNDVTSFPMQDGGVFANWRYSSLASASISGENLTMGEPAKPVEQGGDIAQLPLTEDEQNDETDVQTAKGLPDEAKFEAEYEVPEEKQSSSKFEGTIISSSKAEKKASSKESQQVEVQSEESVVAESVSEQSEHVREETYEIRREKSGGTLNSGVTAYIIVATGTLSLLLIFGKKH